jgi:hypothetical protein
MHFSVLLHLAIALTFFKFHFVIHCVFLCFLFLLFSCVAFPLRLFLDFCVHLLALFVVHVFTFSTYLATIFMVVPTLQLFLHYNCSCIVATHAS